MERQTNANKYKKPQKSRESLKIQRETAYKSFWQKFIVFSFFVVIFGMLALRLALPVPTMSMAENRELKKMPPANLQNIFFGKFTTEFEDYFADTFPLRDPLMNAGEYVSYLYKIPVSGLDSVVVMDNNIMQGDSEGSDEDVEPELSVSPDASSDIPAPTEKAVDNPLTGDAPEDTPQPTPQDMQEKGIYLLTDTAIYKEAILNPDMYTKWAQGAGRLAEALPGKRVIVMSPPNSYPFYADPKYFKPENDQRAGIEDMYSKMASGVYKVDTYPYLDAHKGEYIYYRTDHHWTALGAYYAYNAFCETAGINPEPLEGMQKNTYDKPFLGSNYKQLKNNAKAKLIKQNPDYVDYYVPAAECQLAVYTKTSLTDGKTIPLFDLELPSGTTNYYRIFLGGDYPLIKITTNTLNGRSIAVLKDSYANAFVPFLTAHYQNIYVVDFRDFNKSGSPKLSLKQFAEDNNIDDVLLILCFEFTNSPTYVNWYLKALP